MCITVHDCVCITVHDCVCITIHDCVCITVHGYCIFYSEPCLELFLSYLLSLLKADKFNLGLLAGKVNYLILKHGDIIIIIIIIPPEYTRRIVGVILFDI